METTPSHSDVNSQDHGCMTKFMVKNDEYLQNKLAFIKAAEQVAIQLSVARVIARELIGSNHAEEVAMYATHIQARAALAIK